MAYTRRPKAEGYRPDIPASLRPFLDRGIVTSLPKTNFDQTDGARFISDFLDSRHVGSMFMLKVVPFGADSTDEQPADVMRLGRNVIVISSGKMSTAVSAAEEIRGLLVSEEQFSPEPVRVPQYAVITEPRTLGSFTSLTSATLKRHLEEHPAQARAAL